MDRFARSANPPHPEHHAYLASAYALKGDTNMLPFELARARSLSSRDRFSNIAHLKAVGYFGVEKVRALFEPTYFAGLRKAGMPEEGAAPRRLQRSHGGATGDYM